MANSNSTANAANTKKGDKFTPKTTLNPEMLARHKLRGNTVDSQRYIAFRSDKTVRDFSRMFSTYRLLVHGVTTRHRLASPIRNMAHYFSIPLSKSDSDFSRDKKANAEAVMSKMAAEEASE